MFFSFGTERFPFNRLCDYIQQFIQNTHLTQKIIIQYGSTNCNRLKCLSKKIKLYQYLPYNDFVQLIKKEKTIVIHAGVGSVLDVTLRKKVPIVIPRDPKLNEHLDDQQIQFAEMLKKKYSIPVVYDYKNFVKTISAAQPLTQNINIKTSKDKISDFLKHWIDKQ